MPSEVHDAISDDGDAPELDRLEQVGVGDDADPLVPRLIARLEVRVDIESGRQFIRNVPPK